MRLKQVVLNLLSNAVKYNRAGGTVTLTSEKRGKGKVRISVSDTGPGIPKNKHNELFKPFSRLAAEVTNIEGRYDEITRTLLRDACEETARLYMKRWLAKVAPLLTLETVSWQELVQLATQPSFKMMSEYQRRRNGHPKRHTDSDILVSRKKEKVEPVE